ncbi:MAG TPA: PfkB family carbohydrate kinase [Catenuloplanes sp.]|jgi:sugar/nucleoside kinase (ribokinase family)
MADPPARVAVVGDLVTDVLAVLAGPLAAGSDTPATVRMTGGGQGANTAAWLAWHGARVSLVAAVGTDDAATARLAELAGYGVRCAIRRHPGAATGSVVVVASGTERTMLTDRGANLLLSPADVATALGDAADLVHLHLSGYTLLDDASRPAGLRALALARERGLTTSVDAASAGPLRRVGPSAFAAWIRGVDLLLANTDEATALVGAGSPGRQAGALTGLARAAVLKRGASGAVWAQPDGGLVAVPAEPADAVDATGAGDAFAAGVLVAWLAGRPPQEALRAGAAAGALAVSRLGARPPTRPG